jgi:hypothetical protein
MGALNVMLAGAVQVKGTLPGVLEELRVVPDKDNVPGTGVPKVQLDSTAPLNGTLTV